MADEHTMKVPTAIFVLGLVAALTSHAQSTNQVFKMRATVVSMGRVDGFTPVGGGYRRFERPQFYLTVRVEWIVPPLTNHVKGSLMRLSFSAPANFFGADAAEGKLYDFIMSSEAPGAIADPFELKEPPKPVSQPDGTANRSQPLGSETNRASAAAGSGR